MSGEKTFKGSPGPWTYERVCFDRKIPIRGGVTAYGRPFTIAHVNRPGSAYDGQDKANARLIAAAPALLAACQSAIPGNLATDNPNIPDGQIIPLDFTMGELRAIQAAISQALGGE